MNAERAISEAITLEQAANAGADAGQGRKSGSTLRSLSKAVHWLGFVLFAILLCTFDWERSAAIVASSVPSWLALAAAANVVFITCKSVRWYLLLRMQEIPYPFWTALRVYQAGSFFSVVTPGKLGDLVKALYLKRDVGVGCRIGMAGVVMDRLLDLVTLSATTLALLIFLKTPSEVAWSISAFGVLLLFGAWVGISRKSVPAVLALLEHLPFFGSMLSLRKTLILDAHAALRSLWRPALLGPQILSLAAYAVLYFSAYCLAQAQNLPLSFMEATYCIAVANVVALLPLSISRIGTRDLAMVILFAPMGLGKEEALFFSFGYLVVSLLFANGLGAFCWFRYPIDMKGARDFD